MSCSGSYPIAAGLTLSDISGATVAFCAFCALFVAVWQVYNSRQLTALEMFFDVFRIDVEGDEIQRGTERYESYLIMVLTSYEHVLNSTKFWPGQKKWRDSVKMNLFYFKDDFTEDDGTFNRSKWELFYDKPLVDVMQEVVKSSDFSASVSHFNPYSMPSPKLFIRGASNA